jgi:NADH pyrophosphatase NudC (nudix superfamily)
MFLLYRLSESKDEEEIVLTDDDTSPKMEEVEQTKSKKTKSKKTKKSKKETKGSTHSSVRSAVSKQDVREVGRCSNCANLLTQTRKLNYQEVNGISEKMEKRVSAILCDDCQALKDAGSTLVTLKTAVYKNQDGDITNVPLADLIKV